MLRSVEVTGLINGADLRKTAVWDGIDMPFCVFFARNAKPSADHRFHYAAPSYEPGLNGGGRFRIDYEAAQPISAARSEKRPWLLKTLSLGTWLDGEVMEGLMNPELKTLIGRWLEWDETGNQTGEGYNRAPRTEKSPGSPQKWVEFLAKLPVFRVPEEGYSIEYASLKTYGDTYGTNAKGEASANMPRREELFQPPLVIVPRAPSDDEFATRGGDHRHQQYLASAQRHRAAMDHRATLDPPAHPYLPPLAGRKMARRTPTPSRPLPLGLKPSLKPQKILLKIRRVTCGLASIHVFRINPSTISPLVLDGRLFSVNGAGVISTADVKTGDNGW